MAAKVISELKKYFMKSAPLPSREELIAWRSLTTLLQVFLIRFTPSYILTSYREFTWKALSNLQGYRYLQIRRSCFPEKGLVK